MAKLIWTEPALSDLDAIADYIALDKPDAARQFVQRVFQHVAQLISQPESGSRPPELRRSRYRQIIEALSELYALPSRKPCRIFYRYDGERVFILYVMRGEMRFRKTTLRRRDK